MQNEKKRDKKRREIVIRKTKKKQCIRGGEKKRAWQGSNAKREWCECVRERISNLERKHVDARLLVRNKNDVWFR